MEYRYLGRTGLKVSVISLGAMTFSQTGVGPFGNMPSADKATSFAILDAYVAAGGNFVDTADVYGESEAVLGEWLEKQGDKRKDLVIASKFRAAVGTGPNQSGAGRKHVMDQIESSLKALRTSYLDLYICHVWDGATPLEELLRTLNDLVRSGKVRYIGLSNYTASQIQKASFIARREHLEGFTSAQMQYSLLQRNIEYEILPVCQAEGVGITCWSPLAGGWLSGKHSREKDGAIKGSRVEWADKVGFKQTNSDSHANEKTYNLLDLMAKIATELKTSIAAIALRWCVQRNGVSSVIIGARTLAQFQDNIQAATIRLTEEHMKQLNEASEQPAPYPYNMISQFGSS
jgi:aryl-alcohol dehydrogenase-like predicted oxidoreductase